MTHGFNYNKNDEYYTYEYAVTPIMNRIPKGSKIWCPFDTAESNFVKVFERGGYKVIHSHIFDNQDFFEIDVPDCDYIISNPPYSLKQQVFERLFKIGKPFAMLVNLQGLFDSVKRFDMFANNKFEIMIISPRVQYIKADGTSGSGIPFQSGYVCHNILDKQLEFEYVKKVIH